MLSNIYKSLDDSEVKVLRDPVHEYIHIYDEVIWNLIDTVEFQRLRRIHQLGGTFQVYHGAEHSRFSHSVGVYEIARRMVEEVKDLKQLLSAKERLAVLCAALLHDLGHGPFSHAFESVTQVHHEQLTGEIILGQTQVNEVLSRIDKTFPAMVTDIIAHRHQRKLLTQIISSQLDADRMDYLLRDSYYTGVSYGSFDLERILRTLRVVDDRLVIKYSGIHAVEDYIMARYQMYWQVYYHPTSRAFEVMLDKIFEELKIIYQKDPTFVSQQTPFLVGIVDATQFDLIQYLDLDEFTVMHGFKQLSRQTQYPILADLAYRLTHRNLFESLDYSASGQTRIKQLLRENGHPIKNYYGEDDPKQSLYKVKHNNHLSYIPYDELDENAILVLMPQGQIVEISSVSSLVSAMSKAKLKSDKKIFTLREVIHEYLSKTSSKVD